MKNLYVGNLSYTLSEDELRSAFEQFGEIASCRIIRDRQTGDSRGFGFVEMATDEAAQAAMDNLNGAEVGGRRLRINEAQPKEDFRGGGGRGPRPPRDGE